MSGRREARAPGRPYGGDGECLFDLVAIESILVGSEPAPVNAPAGDGDRTAMALMRLPAGTESETRASGDEQWIFVLEGVLQAVVGGEEVTAGPGSLVHVPAGVAHSGRAGGQCDVVFFTVRSAASGCGGAKAA
jgi:mannose-6-phosphate isomerase-like protein (cupin superfamily)